MPAILSLTATVPIELAGGDRGLVAVLAGAAVLIAAGILLRRLSGARGGTRPPVPSGEPEPAVSAAAGADPREDTPERPGYGHRVGIASPFGALPTPEQPSGGPATVAADGSFAALAETLDRGRRLLAAEAWVARELAELPVRCWMVERFALVAGRRVPFLIVGAGGVFVLAASDGTWSMRELDALAQVAEEVRALVPAHRGPVHAGLCLAFQESGPRRWHGGTERQGRGGWVFGIDWLRSWLYTQGPEEGVGEEELARLHAAAGPHWGRRITARVPGRRDAG